MLKQHLLAVALAQIRPEFMETTWHAFELAWIHGCSPEETAQKLSITVDRLIKLYESWGKPNQAAEWRKKTKAAKAGQTHPSKKP